MRRPRADAIAAAFTRFAFSSNASFRMPFTAALRINSVFDFRDVAGVAQRNLFQRPFAYLCQKRSQPLGQNDVRLQFQIFVMRHGRHVYRILDDAILQIFLHLMCDLIADGFLGLESRAGDVRRQNHVLDRRQRRIL